MAKKTDPSLGLTIRAYADLRKEHGLPGGSPWSVNKALRDGRITRNSHGKIDPEQIKFYLRPLPGDKVYRIREFLLGTFTFQSEHWADKRTFDYPEDAAVRIDVKWEDGSYVLRKVGDEWRLVCLAHNLTKLAGARAAGG